MKDETTANTGTAQTYYLWHLHALGVLEMTADGTGIASTLWDTLAQLGNTSPATVVMIDVGCNFSHPNLRHRVDAAASIDFTAGPEGQRLSSTPATTSNFAGLDVSDLRLDGLSTEDRTFFDDLLTALTSSTGRTRPIGDVEAMFSSHGTAVAGLVVGGPEIQTEADAAPSPGVIPYFGVDPFSRLISVRTGFEDDPMQFIAALLYAKAQNPDVIVMPRGMPDPARNALPFKEDFKAELQSFASREAADLLHRIATETTAAGRIDPMIPRHGGTQSRLWGILRTLFEAISQQVPIVCASGNEGESQMLYPARLASKENGIIAVGAVSGSGFRAGYANYGEGLTVVAPSDDMTVFNRTQVRIGAETATRHKAHRPTGAQQVPFSPQALLSTDIPGSFGYDAGRGTDEPTPDSGFYTRFGGTSGAAALVAGVIALIRRAERLKSRTDTMMDGRDIRVLLTKTARSDLPTTAGALPLSHDTMNAISEADDTLERFFGAGLVDAAAALRRVLG